MGKPITVQRRGKGSSTYRAPSHRYLSQAKYRRCPKEEDGTVKGVVIDIVHNPGGSAPLLKIKYEDGKTGYLLAQEGVMVGDELAFGDGAGVSQGNVLSISRIPEGTPINNIELLPGDGGKIIRSSGSYGLLITHDVGKSMVQMPSGELKTIDSRCRATIGVVAGGGRRDKPLLKAGKMYHKLKPKAKYWPIVRKVRMNPVSHPHGGASGHPGKPTTVSRNTPPGRKVGLIAARRTGKR
ncbi:MAG: 50S ribosomal protein L2 [Candidatus Hydrothermarchaeota archaeon]|jgi:large subunit ribosomal protein L2|nr:50S ribosomal protein L2 [Candidatus Hydrothermarchaeota archaeon]